MRPARLLRSTPFRLAIAFGGLFVAAFLVTEIIAYQFIKTELDERLDEGTHQIWTLVSASYSSGRVEDLVHAVQVYSEASKQEDWLLLLLDPAGKRLAGNIDPAELSFLLEASGPYDVRMADGRAFRIISDKLGDNRLSVGLSLEDNQELEDIAVASFFWMWAVVTLLATAGGAILAFRAQRRLDGIAHTMDEVSLGKFAARIPLTGNGDDIDTVSRQINSALDRLGRVMEGMKQVSTDIAHDLKTPLNRLRMKIETAMASSERGAGVEDALQAILEESRRINETFEALLRIAQIESGARRARFTQLDLADVLASVTELYADAAHEMGRRLSLEDMGGARFMISGDHELLVQLFANLVENAIRHCPEGSEVRLSLHRNGGVVTAEVADDGPGIPPGEREKVFQRFYRLDKSRTTRGTGLGLTLVRAIADLHTVPLELTDNRPGLRVVLRFPLLQA